MPQAIPTPYPPSVILFSPLTTRCQSSPRKDSSGNEKWFWRESPSKSVPSSGLFLLKPLRTSCSSSLMWGKIGNLFFGIDLCEPLRYDVYYHIRFAGKELTDEVGRR